MTTTHRPGRLLVERRTNAALTTARPLPMEAAS
jgi:hypothetical protein